MLIEHHNLILSSGTLSESVYLDYHLIFSLTLYFTFYLLSLFILWC